MNFIIYKFIMDIFLNFHICVCYFTFNLRLHSNFTHLFNTVKLYVTIKM